MPDPREGNAEEHELPSHQTLQLDKRQELMNDFQIVISRQDDSYAGFR